MAVPALNSCTCEASRSQLILSVTVSLSQEYQLHKKDAQLTQRLHICSLLVSQFCLLVAPQRASQILLSGALALNFPPALYLLHHSCSLSTTHVSN